MYHTVGAFNGEGPPVPIPNTEVKLTHADNTWLEAAREDRSMPTLRPQSLDCGFSLSKFTYAPLAQLVEHLTLNQGVQGSSP